MWSLFHTLFAKCAVFVRQLFCSNSIVNTQTDDKYALHQHVTPLFLHFLKSCQFKAKDKDGPDKKLTREELHLFPFVQLIVIKRQCTKKPGRVWKQPFSLFQNFHEIWWFTISDLLVLEDVQSFKVNLENSYSSVTFIAAYHYLEIPILIRSE